MPLYKTALIPCPFIPESFGHKMHDICLSKNTYAFSTNKSSILMIGSLLPLPNGSRVDINLYNSTEKPFVEIFRSYSLDSVWL